MDESETDINLLNTSYTRPSNSSANTEATVFATEPPPKQSKPSIKFDSTPFYDMSGDKFMVIFNHVDFMPTENPKNQLKSRAGTDKDVTSLRETFVKLGFKVFTHKDKKRKEIIKIMEAIREQDHLSTSCLIVVILTHGDKGGYLHAYDKSYLLKELTSILETATGLVNKPKLFFIQACRGDKTDEGRSVPNSTETDGPEDNCLVVPPHVDFLFMQSSVDDHRSYRDPRGSWLIQELCKVVNTHHHELNLLQLATLTQWNVAYGWKSYAPSKLDIHNKKQMPETRFTLRKLVKFSN